eukprot:TRINITY_DN10168_c1_g1_i2.p1 TRINITY_DN10168_c1_g1~~TRINITY_DN10168_c1_g1_i2.p1  ORF type:complete len:370 (+),score=23.74 TRINITY_DN10168_c1_g1_i2:104-1213(+)
MEVLLCDVLLLIFVATVAIFRYIDLRSYVLQAAGYLQRLCGNENSEMGKDHGENNEYVKRWPKSSVDPLRKTCRTLNIEDGIRELMVRCTASASCWLDANAHAASIESVISRVISSVSVEAFAFSNLSCEQSCGLVLNIKTKRYDNHGIRKRGNAVMRSQGKALLSPVEAAYVVNTLEVICSSLKEKQLISFAKIKGSAAMPFAEVRLRQKERGKIRAILYVDYDLPRWTHIAHQKMEHMFHNGRNLVNFVVWWAIERGFLMAGRTDHSKAHIGTYAWSTLVVCFLEQHDRANQNASVLTLFKSFVSYCMEHTYFVDGDASSLIDPFGHQVKLESMLSSTGHRQLRDEFERAHQRLTNADLSFAQLLSD